MTPRVSIVVPSVGRAPGLPETLAGLRTGGETETILVAQGWEPGAAILTAVDQTVRLPDPVGFAAAANRGVERARGELVLLLNDDARASLAAVGRLADTLEGIPEAAAVQPVVLDPAGRVDSLGIAWNAWWQAVQRGHGGRRPTPGIPSGEIFGAHAAVALFRRRALAAVALDGRVFDEALGTYYEDVELAGRLRAAGWLAHLESDAEAWHRGGASAQVLGPRRLLLLYRNRLLVLARFLGDGLRRALPRILARDVVDGLRAPSRWPAIVGGWRQARAEGPEFAARGGYRMPLESLRRFRER